MKKIVIALALVAGLASSPAIAQFSEAGSPAPVQQMPGVIGGAIGSPTYVIPPAPVQGGGIIDIGQALGPFLQPYVDALAQALICSLVGWVLLVVKKKFNVTIDETHRDALITALQNQAGSLIADGFVKIQNGKVTVPSVALAESANEVMAVIPDAAARLGVTPDYVAKRIVDVIPQTAAGAAMIAAAAPPATRPPLKAA